MFDRADHRAVEFLEETESDRDLNRVIGRHHDIVAEAPLLELGDRLLVRLVGIDRHLDTGKPLEVGQDIGVDIVAPIEDGELVLQTTAVDVRWQLERAGHDRGTRRSRRRGSGGSDRGRGRFPASTGLQHR
ncbi:MAG: hypothetical protein RMJ05_06645 [Thermomicrobium sp.]|nr:hypothetical protein [Thermomicrobium sp.]MDW8006381.1 hypothetical protein [Thermomicrobium sp.]